MNENQSETRHSVGFAGRLACAGLLIGAAGLITALPASAGGLGLGGGLGVGASVSVGGAHVDAGTTADTSTSASVAKSSSDDGNTTTKSVDAAANTATDAEVTASKRHGEDEKPVAILDASVAAEAAAAADVSVRHPTTTRATK